jgi:hypothetical protein
VLPGEAEVALDHEPVSLRLPAQAHHYLLLGHHFRLRQLRKLEQKIQKHCFRIHPFKLLRASFLIPFIFTHVYNTVHIQIIISFKQCSGSMTLWWIRIRGSMPLTNGSGSGFGFGSWIQILLFSSLTFKMPAKNKFFNTIFSACYVLKVHLHYFQR